MEEIKKIKQSINIITVIYSILFIFMLYNIVDSNKRLDAHKEVIINLNTYINEQKCMLFNLQKNQILINKKIKNENKLIN